MPRDLDPVAFCDRHQRVVKWVALPLTTVLLGVVAWVTTAQWQAPKTLHQREFLPMDLLAAVSLFGAITAGSILIYVVLAGPCERVARWLKRLPMVTRPRRVAARIRAEVLSRTLIIVEPKRRDKRHRWDYYGYHNPVTVSTVTRRIAND